MPRILFHRSFTEYTGGHGKVWSYFQHALALGWDARVYLTPDSLLDANNPWMAVKERIAPTWQPSDCDLLFLAGMDWLALDDVRRPPRPVINLLQHVRHGRSGHPLRSFLPSPAWRVCVSQAVAEAIQDTGEVNGSVTVIPAALDLPECSLQLQHAADRRVLVAGMKAPALARALADALHTRGVAVELLDRWLPRHEYLAKVGSAVLAVTLPHPEEGFYLPGLEAMALGVPVVLADCLGSREYARDGENCLLAAFESQSLADAVQRALQPPVAARLRRQGLATAARHGLEEERKRFAEVLKQVEADT
ncbi:glycosyltransferase [Thermomonas brevis]|uniref:Glycosyltransferase n=1 Tax=Thermomonas brevis TaxID=215691 RepID=A0A7G9QWW8_9GAMM|nr:glycosyltransferase [Thermomonas brevis]QNN47843.1 glycosyltransferase [Thermomonas brevis]